MRSDQENQKGRVLIAAKDIAYAHTLARFMDTEGYETERCHDTKGLLRLVTRRSFDIAVLDLALSGDTAAEFGHLDLVSFIRRQQPDTHIILLFDIAKVERAIEGIRAGAYFYLPKTSQPSDVALVVAKALRKIHTEAALNQYEQSLFEEMVGGAPAMKRVIEVITKVAPTDSTVLLLGESGTGKEILAHAIHRLSPRHDRPFVAINCAALPETLLESEMFGHVKGAFTGAEADKRGLFEEADGGSIFLDEIGDMAPQTQAKLLRVLQNGEIRPVGSSTSKQVDVRVIAATNQDLVEAVQSHKFREDLYFRLNVIQIRIPPLRERLDALPALVNHFLARFNAKFGKNVRRIDEQAQALLRAYPYPGNVRELESIIAHAVILCEGDEITVRDLPDSIQQGISRRLALPHYASQTIATLNELEEQAIRATLQKLEGNQTEAAKKLGISRSTLWRKMKEYHIVSN
jgi:two-component system response regulator HydG